MTKKNIVLTSVVASVGVLSIVLGATLFGVVFKKYEGYTVVFNNKAYKYNDRINIDINELTYHFDNKNSSNFNTEIDSFEVTLFNLKTIANDNSSFKDLKFKVYFSLFSEDFESTLLTENTSYYLKTNNKVSLNISNFSKNKNYNVTTSILDSKNNDEDNFKIITNLPINSFNLTIKEIKVLAFERK